MIITESRLCNSVFILSTIINFLLILYRTITAVNLNVLMTCFLIKCFKHIIKRFCRFFSYLYIFIQYSVIISISLFSYTKNMYNLNTKRAIVEEGGVMEWVSGSFGSHTSYLYPMTILKGKGSRMEFTGITFAGHGQNLDTGAKVVHTGADTSSYINTKSISKDGGISTFRSAVVINKDAKNSKAAVSCQSLMLDTISRSDTIPAMDVRTPDADVGHEARIGRISDDAVFYLMSRGIPEEEARAMIVSGFADNVSKELPLEYAMEMNNLIRLEMKGSIG